MSRGTLTFAQVTQPPRWEPDVGMVAAILSTPKASRRITEMRDGDRAWVIAGLELAGETAERTAERMGCSLRLVRSLRAEDITQLAKLVQIETSRLEMELGEESSAHSVTRRDLGELRRENARLRKQLDQIIGPLVAGALNTFPRCGHPAVPFNIYEHNGRQWCRMCECDRKVVSRCKECTPDQRCPTHVARYPSKRLARTGTGYRPGS